MDRHPMDMATYSEQAVNGPCFICRMLAGDPDYAHEVVYQDADHVAFLDRWPVLPGKLLVCPRAHLEHCVADLTAPAYQRMMQAVRLVALAAEDVLPGERTYLFSMGSQAGNAHLHWHIARLPEGVPYEQQLFEALKFENGVLMPTAAESADLAARLRAAIAARAATD
ncbi:HIT family protein [Streptacidiphilus carbonis]|uniref:HIT family protein n=1 Tax=Streptacidiphilus carbonis TaxID=105422 RepID=UPI000AB1B20B|nr:HIT domain-containing protein [Streptacidiphilus carbonis]